MPKWILDIPTELGAIIMAIFAGTAAYIKSYEKSDVEWSGKKHVMQFSMRQFYAVFASMLVWYCIQWASAAGYPVPAPAVPILIGIAAYNGVRVVDFLTTTMMDWLRKKLGLEPKNETP